MSCSACMPGNWLISGGTGMPAGTPASFAGWLNTLAIGSATGRHVVQTSNEQMLQNQRGVFGFPEAEQESQTQPVRYPPPEYVACARGCPTGQKPPPTAAVVSPDAGAASDASMGMLGNGPSTNARTISVAQHSNSSQMLPVELLWAVTTQAKPNFALGSLFPP